MSNMQTFNKGFFKENAVFVQLLGMCPTLAVTTTAFNGLGMGLATTFVLSDVKYCSVCRQELYS